MANALLSIRTLLPKNTAVDASTIAVATDIDDLSSLEPFVASVCQQFKVFRTTCPAAKYNLLITVIGTNCAEAFAQVWKRLAKDDSVLHAYTQGLVSAEVLIGTREGEIIESASLLG